MYSIEIVIHYYSVSFQIEADTDVYLKETGSD